jgi:methylase of polypeptide subunit release factors
MTPEQTVYVREHLAMYQEAGFRTVKLDDATSLDLFIDEGVFRSDLMKPSLYLARTLHRNPQILEGVEVLDMGCGPGLQGLVMGQYANHTTLVDINPKAVEDVKENMKYYGFSNDAYVSDLFADVPKRKYDRIVFNHPFFDGDSETFDVPVDTMTRRSLLGGTETMERFFRDVPHYLENYGLIIMPYYKFAGPQNDPKRGLKMLVSAGHGVDVEIHEDGTGERLLYFIRVFDPSFPPQYNNPTNNRN